MAWSTFTFYRESSDEQNSVEIIVDNGKNEIFETIKESQEETIRLEAKDIAELKVGQSQKVFSFWFYPQKKHPEPNHYPSTF